MKWISSHHSEYVFLEVREFILFGQRFVQIDLSDHFKWISLVSTSGALTELKPCNFG